MSARFSSALLALVLLAQPVAAGAATVTIVNTDGAGEGFNDPTPATPVGGNSGTTLGQQRLIAFQRAAEIWGATLASNVEILVQASFNPLSCDASSAVLGSAGTIQIISDFPNAPFANTWYHTALANSIAGADQIPGPTNSNADDIRAQFNSSIDNNDNCLAGTNWYLGLDHNEPGTDIDLLAVLLHEFGHGLGHSNFVNESTGAYAGPPLQRDIYTIFSLDNSNGLHWDEMSNAQRAASAINTGNVVWDGPNVAAEAPSFLDGRPVMIINSPPAIAGTSEVQSASFGPSLTTTGVTGNVVVANDGSGVASDGCEPFINGGAVNGNIALVDRGTCNFSVKVKNGQDAGAIAVLVANNVATGLPPMGGDDPTITIPSVGISQADGNDIRNNLPANVTLKLDETLLAGADDNGLVRLYAPNPVESGSSISHWDVVATPNLLMEPFINADLTDDLDLSVEQMVDVGWALNNPAVCGNDTRETGEVCDGTDLGGETCASQAGCTGGTLACNGTCDGFDTSACTGCPACDNDGTCEAGEDCDGCPNDCDGGSSSGAQCNNGICEAADGENCLTCPQDCDGVQGGKPSNRFCCGDGIAGSGAVTCSDARCTDGGDQCTNLPVPGGSFCCGDFTCDSGESCGNCALDCATGGEVCTGGVDEDCDGDVDCDDNDCSGDPSCQACVPTASKEKGPRCSDGIDNDCDGLIDGADPDC
jgi:hypothetical protein